MIIIYAPHFVAAVILDNGKVIRTPPMVKYMKGWTWDTVLLYCDKKEWTAIRIPP